MNGLAKSLAALCGLLNERIPPNMGAPLAGKNGNLLHVVRGGLYASRPVRVTAKTVADWRLDEEMATAFAGITGENGTVPSKGIYDIRDRSQHPWRVLARRFKEARAAKAELDQALAPVRVLETWVRNLWNEPGQDRAA